VYSYYHLCLLVSSYFSMGYLSDIVELLSLGLVESREDDIGVSLYMLQGDSQDYSLDLNRTYNYYNFIVYCNK
jgi:hypothetical protein